MKKKQVKVASVLVWTMMLGGMLLVGCSDENGESGDTQGEHSPYITQVLDFCPAPGQFVNSIPMYKAGDTQETMNQKVLNSIGNGKKGIISLGAYGGYVVVGFDHTIQNVAGSHDFRVLGNAFYAESNLYADSPQEGGSCEPGIVLVAYDKNQNGKPDEDEWYELAGSEYSKPETTKNYEITYYRPDESKAPVPGGNHILDKEYIRWTDNQGRTGYVEKNVANSQYNYYPQWITSESITFKGTLLPNNAVNKGTDGGELWILTKLDWGYADNVPNDLGASTFDIDWAVDKEGKKVSLPGVDFIKIYTGVNQNAGWLGETSTEVGSVEDIHLSKK